MRPRRSVLVLQHASCEPLAAYDDALDDRGFAAEALQLDRGVRLPPTEGFDAVIAMGGPMSVNDEEAFPWLVDEKRLIREIAQAGRPFWGVCLGAQLLASSLAARVYEGREPEVGVLPVHLERAGRLDPVFSALPPDFLTLQWHSDTFELPEGSILLASSPAYRYQAFRWKRAFGLQFHLEVSVELVQRWCDIPAYAQALDQVMGEDGLARLLTRLSEEAAAMRSHALGLFGRWLDLLVAPSVVDSTVMGTNR
jgi:GMP synthase (glutamine-hydrolysing)